jgi:hypothetical protein
LDIPSRSRNIYTNAKRLQIIYEIFPKIKKEKVDIDMKILKKWYDNIFKADTISTLNKLKEDYDKKITLLFTLFLLSVLSLSWCLSYLT